MQLKQNQIFASHYRLERLLGRGGFSEVWLAYDQTADVRVAIKVYAPGTGLDNDGVELFRKEFKIVFDMNHSNLLRPNYYSIEDNMPYLVMPYIERGSTTKMIGKMPETEVWKFIRDVAAGLAYLHAKEPPVIHQDIKPDNVMLTNDGTYVITDFGISTRARSTLRKSVNANASAGTQAYMGPERFGKQPAPIKASDVWSLGATVYELMEGDVPFGDFGGINQKSGAEIPDINGNYSDELKELVLACLCQETWNRPTAEQLSDYASDKLRDRNPVMSWKKKDTDGQHENTNGRETQVIINTEQQIAKKNGKDGNAETHGESDKPKRNLAWLWILLVAAILEGVFAFYGNKKKKTDGRQQTELERFDQEQQDADDNIFFQNCKDVADYRSYLNKYPNGLNVELARNKIDKHVADSTAEAERQRQVAAENERKAQEAERQRQIAAENERKAQEAERQRQIEAENERKAQARFKDMLFPVCGITLGETTVDDIKNNRLFDVEYRKDGDIVAKDARYGAFFWSFRSYGNDYFNRIFLTKFEGMFDKWKTIGFDWSLSYDEWVSLLQGLGFNVKVTKSPTIEDVQGRNCLGAKFEATSGDGKYILELDFAIGNTHGEGCSTTSKNSLFRIELTLPYPD